MSWFSHSKSAQDIAAQGTLGQDGAGGVSEAEIAVHWQEEGFVEPPQKSPRPT